MSAIGGIYNLDGAPVDEELLSQMGHQLNFRGPDGGREVVCGSIGMTYRAFHTNKESRLENQPVMTPDGLLLCWDGRLDNRRELISLLRPNLRGVHTDVSIVMAAYIEWGLDFLAHIIGDFALSLWDPRARKLLLARDPIGPRTLYYQADERRILWSTELAPLLDLTKMRQEVNDEYIADYLTRLPDPSQTPYKNMHAVTPAHLIIVSEGRLRTQRYWGLNPKNQIRYRSDGEYEEHFHELFREAVRCRLRVEGTAWAELSGGLDSSSIVCMAQDVIDSGEAEVTQLETISNVFDEAYESDERQYIRYVENKMGRKGRYIREDDFRFFAPLAGDCGITIPNPITNFAEYYIRLNELMRENGVRVLLSGKGGDEILCSAVDPMPELADLLVQCRLFSLHRQLKVWSHTLKEPYVRLLWQRAIRQVVPDSIKILCSRRAEAEFFLLFNQQFSRSMNLPRRRLGPSDVFGHRYPSGRDQANWFLRIVRELSAGYWREFGNAEFSYPFTHRPLVEFMQATPFDQRVRLDHTRSLLRRALRDLLPTEIVERRGKTLNTQAALCALTRGWPRLNRLFANPMICANGYIDLAALRSKLILAKEGKDPMALSLAFLIPLELWLQSLAQRS